MTAHCLSCLSRVTVEIVICVVLMWIPQPTSAGAEAKIRRVRPIDSPSIARLLDEGINRSLTFRRLVETIDATDGIVYVQEGRCGHNVRACLTLSVRVAGPHRVLRIVVNMRRDHDALIAAIGHELQHAVEALSDAHVTDDATIYSLFDRIGPTARGRFETQAAIRTGMAVLGELRAARRCINGHELK